MIYPRYPTYFDSDIEWLGKIPTHWNAERLKHVCKINPSKSEISGLPADCMVSFVPMEAVGENGGLNLEQIKPLYEVAQGYTYFRDGDVVVAKITPCFENGKGALARGLTGGIAFGTTELHVLRPKQQQIDARFLLYTSLSSPFRKLGEGEMYGAGGQKRVPESYVLDFRQPIPPLLEQVKIATFLDRETAKIDTLIAKQERLIALLQEKRQALISHVVTKGLNPDAPMKESGVEWLGRIPIDWTIQSVWMMFTLGRGRVISNEDIYANPGDYPVYSSQTENDGEMGRIDTYDFEGSFITWTTDGANAGTVFYRDGRFNCTNVCGTLKPKNDRIDLEYFTALLNCATASYVRQDINPKLMNNVMGKIKVPVPPYEVQTAILSVLRAEMDAIEALCHRAAKLSAILQERRAALISAAVTGKIDVRGL